MWQGLSSPALEPAWRSLRSSSTMKCPGALYGFLEQLLEFTVAVQKSICPAVRGSQLLGSHFDLSFSRTIGHRSTRSLDSIDATATHEPVQVVAGGHVNHFGRLAGAGSMEHLPVAHIDADMVRSGYILVGVEEDQIARAKALHSDGLTLADLVVGNSGQLDSEVSKAVLHQAGTIEASRLGTAPDVRRTLELQQVLDDVLT